MADCDAARTFVKNECEADVDDSLLGTLGSHGVARSVRFVSDLDGDKSSLILVESHFKRGGYREHDRIYLVSVHRASKAILKCVSVESHASITVIRDSGEA